MTIEVRATTAAARMAEAARRFLASLTPQQRAVAQITFFGDERYRWNYRPLENMPRNGLWLIAMTAEQQRAAHALLESGLSARAADQARRIMQRETTLREHERIEGLIFKLVRDPQLFWWSVFGEPGGDAPWGWRVCGHHVSVHFTVVGDAVAYTPCFLGANPAEARHGPDKGDRILPEEEDMARDLLATLDEGRKAVAIYSPTAPTDIVTDITRRVYPGIAPLGLPLHRMDERSQSKLVALVRQYLGRGADDLADASWRRIEAAGLDTVAFAWAGPEQRGAPHYYAITGPTFLIEYDNTQNGANHIHSVLRQFDGDWGEDLLAEHYANVHREGTEHHHH